MSHTFTAEILCFRNVSQAFQTVVCQTIFHVGNWEGTLLHCICDKDIVHHESAKSDCRSPQLTVVFVFSNIDETKSLVSDRTILFMPKGQVSFHENQERVGPIWKGAVDVSATRGATFTAFRRRFWRNS